MTRDRQSEADLEKARLRWSRALAGEAWCKKDLEETSLDEAWAKLAEASRRLLRLDDDEEEEWGVGDFLGHSGLVVASGNADNLDKKYVTLKVNSPPLDRCHTGSQPASLQQVSLASLYDDDDDDDSSTVRTVVKDDSVLSRPVVDLVDASTSTPRRRGRSRRHSDEKARVDRASEEKKRQYHSYWLPGGVGGTITVGSSSRPTHAAWASPPRATEPPQKVGARKLGLPPSSFCLKSAPPPSHRKRKERRRASETTTWFAEARAGEYSLYWRRGGELPSKWSLAAAGARWKLLRAGHVCALEIYLDSNVCRGAKRAFVQALASMDEFDELVSFGVVVADSVKRYNKLFSSSDTEEEEEEAEERGVTTWVAKACRSETKKKTLRHLALVGLLARRGDQPALLLLSDLEQQAMSSLRSLDLSRNMLESSPRFLPRTIVHLCLAHNKLKSTAYLEHLSHLQTLDMSHNLLPSVAALYPLVLARSSLVELKIFANPLCRAEPAWRLSVRDLFQRAAIVS